MLFPSQGNTVVMVTDLRCLLQFGHLEVGEVAGGTLRTPGLRAQPQQAGTRKMLEAMKNTG